MDNNKVYSLLVGVTVGIVAVNVLFRGIDWYTYNIVQFTPIPCWEANWKIISRRDAFNELSHQSPDENLAEPTFGLFNCTNDGKFWILSTAIP